MWLIVGLGNPGRRYSKTRHNVGFLVIDEILKREEIELKEKELYGYQTATLKNTSVVLIKPLTFMNASGDAVESALKRFNISNERLIVIHDDIDMPIGRLKIRKNGSSGGHKGVGSIIKSVGRKDFIRVKLGIGKDVEMLPQDYVLTKFTKDQLPLIKEVVKKAAEAVTVILKEGVEKAMNRFNTRV